MHFIQLVFGESRNIKDTAQVTVFVHGVDKSFSVTEELASVVSLKGTTKDSDILKAEIIKLNRLKLNLYNISGVTTDGAPSMFESRQGLVKLLLNEASKAGNNSVMKLDCVILYIKKIFMQSR